MNTPDTSTPFAAQSLSKSYGAHTALSDVSLALPAGRVIGLLDFGLSHLVLKVYS